MKRDVIHSFDVKSLAGEISFDSALLKDSLDALTRRTTEYGEQITFGSRLRFLAKMYEFLGGQRFTERVAEKLGASFSQWAVLRWLQDQHTPPPNTCTNAITIALVLIKEIEQKRLDGQSLHDISKTY